MNFVDKINFSYFMSNLISHNDFLCKMANCTDHIVSRLIYSKFNFKDFHRT